MFVWITVVVSNSWRHLCAALLHGLCRHQWSQVEAIKVEMLSFMTGHKNSCWTREKSVTQKWTIPHEHFYHSVASEFSKFHLYCLPFVWSHNVHGEGWIQTKCVLERKITSLLRLWLKSVAIWMLLNWFLSMRKYPAMCQKVGGRTEVVAAEPYWCFKRTSPMIF